MTLRHCLNLCHYLLACQDNPLSSPPLPHSRQTLLNLSSPIHPEPWNADAALVLGVYVFCPCRRLASMTLETTADTFQGSALFLPCGVIKMRMFHLWSEPLSISSIYLQHHSLSLSISLSPLSCWGCHACMLDPQREYPPHTHTHTFLPVCSKHLSHKDCRTLRAPGVKSQLIPVNTRKNNIRRDVSDELLFRWHGERIWNISCVISVMEQGTNLSGLSVCDWFK